MITRVILSVVGGVLCGTLLFSGTSQASGFQPGNIIDDPVFINASTMSVADIQNFLNSKVPVCDTWGEGMYGSITRRQYAEQRGYQLPIVCLKEYVENGKSSAQIIYDIAQQYQINPQVLIVLLQKEQGLITDTWPFRETNYRSATGYGCPDTAPCDSLYYGFTNQVTWAAKMFRAIMNNSPTWYTPYILGNNYIRYSPDSSCGGSYVNIQNRATQALYNYTPYQPNQAALDAGWGSVPCGAYGNRNFYLYFTSWFGSTTGPNDAWMPVSQNIYNDSQLTQPIPVVNGGYYLQPNQKAYMKVTIRNIARTTWSNSNTRLGTFGPIDRPSLFSNSTWIDPTRPSAMAQSTVAPNQDATFTFELQAPSNPGSHTERFSLVHDGVAWVANSTISARIYIPSNYSQLDPTRSSLPVNQSITKLGSLYSPRKSSVLRLSKDGNLELYVNFNKVWESGTKGSNATKLINQNDGNVVLYTDDNTPVWSTASSGNGASTLILQSNGDLVLYNSSLQATWNSKTSGHSELITGNQNMTPGQTLLPEQSIFSANNTYRLVLQKDGNLVLYDQSIPVWSSKTYKTNADRLSFQRDGNIVLYDTNGSPLWSSNTFGKRSDILEVQQDRNIVLYNFINAIWATDTIKT